MGNDVSSSETEVQEGDIGVHYAASTAALHQQRIRRRLQIVLCGVWACWAAIYIVSRVSGVSRFSSGRGWDADAIAHLSAGLRLLIWWQESALRYDSVFTFYLVGAVLLWIAANRTVSRRVITGFGAVFLLLALADGGSLLVLSQYSDVLMRANVNAALARGASRGVSYSLDGSTVVGSIIVYAPLLCFWVLLALGGWRKGGTGAQRGAPAADRAAI